MDSNYEVLMDSQNYSCTFDKRNVPVAMFVRKTTHVWTLKAYQSPISSSVSLLPTLLSWSGLQVLRCDLLGKDQSRPTRPVRFRRLL